MNTTPALQWPLVLGLGALGLIRPLAKIVEAQTGVTGSAALPILLTIAITVSWIAIVGLSRTARPVLTLVGAGLTYAVLVIVINGILSPILTGQIGSTLAQPIAVISILLTNAVWGLIAGVLALLLQQLSGKRPPTAR